MKSICHRIMIFGRPGSGKSTYAHKISSMSEIPLYHLDKYFFTKNWIERDKEEFLQIQKELVDKEEWIIDGNAMHSLEVRYQRAEVAIYFHFPIWICLWRIFRRIFQKRWHIDDMAEGCTKSARIKLLLYMIRFHRRYFPLIGSLHEKYPDVQLYIVRSNRDLEMVTSKLFSQG